MAHALIVDDNPDTVEALTALVEAEGFSTTRAATVEQARHELNREPPDVVLLDLNLPDGNGLSLIQQIHSSGTSIVLITGQASVTTAVEALRCGVTDYLTKPLDVERLQKLLHDIERTKRLPDELKALRAEQQRTGRFAGIVGRSESILRTCDLISRIAPSSASVLITGQSGTGKDVVARAIHELSRRRHGPFVPVNCAAVSPTLIESELFGHERGSFTGADRRHRGYFEQATHGTLFLDEITEMPPELQVKLLRVLETDSVARVGGEQPLRIDVRVLAATNCALDEALQKGKLRGDLYYRLKVFHIDLPPLCDRRDDIELLAQAFLEELVTGEGRAKRFSEAAIQKLRAYAWPGNVRQLRNAVHFAYVLSEDVIDVDSLPPEVVSSDQLDDSRDRGPGDEQARSGSWLSVRVGSTIADVERRLIMATLREYGDNKPKVADVLGISLKTLYNRLNRYQSSTAGESTDRRSEVAAEPDEDATEEVGFH